MAQPKRPDLTHGLLAGNQDTFEHVTAVLRGCNGNVTHAADVMGVPDRTLRRWLKRWPELAKARAIGWAGQ